MAAAVAGTAAQPGTKADIAGMYFCEGTNADGTAYHGVVTIVRRADAYYVLWELQPAVTAFGVGLREGDTLGVSYYGPNTGIIMYRIEGDRLVGRWTVPGGDNPASETLMPLDQAPGRPSRETPGAPGGTGSGLPISL
jgi:hypothetical protein